MKRGIRRWWPHRTMELWHPLSPGIRVTADVLWPRYLFLQGPGPDGRPQSFATCPEVLRRHRDLDDIRRDATRPRPRQENR